ncbi:MAG TPA: ABC transporter permease [Candidatus Dormibacteraeota bacterium]|nr:ABC transporter permease [Candidatus Dormibacteraeota bacterium]
MEILHNIAQRRLRSTLTIGGIVVGVLALTLTGAMAEHFHAQFEGGDAYFRSNIQVADDAGSYAGVISLSKIDPIQKVPGVAVALPSIGLPARPGSATSVPLGAPDTIAYADPRERDHSRLKAAIADGRQLQPNRQGEVVLGHDLANEYGVKVGDRLDLPIRPQNANPDFVNHPFKVVGILKKTNTLPDATASVGLLDAQMLLQESLPASFRDRLDPSSLASRITVYGKPGVDLDMLADRINATVPGVTATRPTDFVNNFDQGARFAAIAVGTALLALLFGAILLINTMVVAVIERQGEIALKMTFGAQPWHIVAEYLLEATIIGLVGGLIGFAAGAGLAALLDLAGRTVNMDVFLITDRLAKITLGLSLALGVGAGMIPSLRAARLDPDRALRAP